MTFWGGSGSGFETHSDNIWHIRRNFGEKHFLHFWPDFVLKYAYGMFLTCSHTILLGHTQSIHKSGPVDYFQIMGRVIISVIWEVFGEQADSLRTLVRSPNTPNQNNRHPKKSFLAYFYLLRKPLVKVHDKVFYVFFYQNGGKDKLRKN